MSDEFRIETKTASRRLICPTCEETVGTTFVTVRKDIPDEDLKKLQLLVAIDCTEYEPGKFSHDNIKVDKVIGCPVLTVHFTDSWFGVGN